KQKALAFGNECLAQAREHWPHLFDKKNMKPLKVGINNDLIAENKLPENTINFALWRFCKTWAYRELVKENAIRYDKEGNPVGKVEKDQSYPDVKKQTPKAE
ncbi:ProQ/FinO family protein, partial [Endozoicomonas sp. SM1973]